MIAPERPDHPELAPFLDAAPAWLTDEGPFPGVILSSRVRFARNLASVPFPPVATPEQRTVVVGRIRGAAGEVGALADARYLDVGAYGVEDLEFLVERRLISRDLTGGRPHRGVLVGRGERLSIMVNEEDHLRIQSVVSGLRVGEALDAAGEVDDALSRRIDFAFSPRLGYLTACPTNVGTGMRASVLAHLPGLVLTRRAKQVLSAATAMGLAVRGFYGEGTEVMGNFIQISNQRTLGRSENEIVSALDQMVHAIVEQEEQARDTMWTTARIALEDKIYRAWGTLRHARSIGAREVLSLTSAVRFGLTLELPGLCPAGVLNEIVVFSQPGHVSRRAGRELDREERRELRAGIIRARLDAIEDRPEDGNR